MSVAAILKRRRRKAEDAEAADAEEKAASAAQALRLAPLAEEAVVGEGKAGEPGSPDNPMYAGGAPGQGEGSGGKKGKDGKGELRTKSVKRGRSKRIHNTNSFLASPRSGGGAWGNIDMDGDGEITLGEMKQVPGAHLHRDKTGRVRAVLPPDAIKIIRDKTIEGNVVQRGYLNLCMFLGYFFIYVVVYALQSPVNDQYYVKESVVNVILADSTEAVDPATGEFATEFDTYDDGWDWLSSTITSIFTDPTCGDDECSSAELTEITGDVMSYGASY